MIPCVTDLISVKNNRLKVLNMKDIEQKNNILFLPVPFV